ncbi:MAG: DUF1217 domain-containing protein [Oceanibaculum nanhaiense]|uniref:DUF1217 domain-containing protein n=1 Tax=Oceanibaculum nanhaiense TaxID=1909734 RepID=UPI0025A477A7|nr:DUF1217 domain-containing protein [Oceanibaculum nanhaiense]MDM7946570.1 DUF1217 domain-containing protein [Oceanibaculum nanhaiense]
MVANVAFMSGVSAALSFQMLQKNTSQQITQFGQTAQIMREVDYFKKKAGSLTSMDDLIKDRRLMNFALSAFSLEGEAQYPARLRKVLESDLEDNASLANRLSDNRYREIAAAFDYAKSGMDKLQDASFLEELSQKYVLNEFEKALGNNNPALREATYFLRNIGNVTSPYEILGDSVLRSVVTFTLNLPSQIAVQSVESQARLIEGRLDLDKFKGAESTSAAASTSLRLEDARNDQTLLYNGVQLSKQAIAQVDKIQEQLELIRAGYGALDAVQDPAGEFQAEIPVQEAAIPELVRQNGLLSAANESLGRINGYVSRMNTLVGLANDPANESKLDSYKTEFAELRDKINTAYGEATYSYDDGDADAVGTQENLLDGTLANLSVQYKSTGETTTTRSQDLTGFLADIDAANASFQAVTGSGDAGNLATAGGIVTSSATGLATIRKEVTADRKALTEAIDSIPQFAATLNSASLYPGAEAVRDAGSRLGEVNLLLGELRGLAVQSTALAAGADRSALQTQYDEIVGKIGTLISDPRTPGLDNLLAGGNQSYKLLNDFNIEARGRDLVTSVLDELTGRDISSFANAQDVLGALDNQVATATGTAFREISIDASSFNLASEKLDPRAAVDSAYRKLSNDLNLYVNAAAVDGRNLLSATQDDVKYRVESSGRLLTVDAISDFTTNFGGILSGGADGLPSDGGDSTGAIAALDEAMFSLGRVRDKLNSDLRTQQMEKSIVDATLAQSVATESPGLTDPYAGSSKFAMEFIGKFLAMKDAESAGSQLGLGSGRDAYLLNLVQPINFNFNV